jgi:ABC-type multidrug transport system ATPase subunit
MTSNGKTSFKG